jgi:hypothetical protein
LFSSRVRRMTVVAVTTGLAASMLGFSPAHSASIQESWFPAGVALDSSAYVLQFAGANRDATAATIALSSAVAGGGASAGYPFNQADGTGSAASNKLYGPGVCPGAVVLAADDTPADALSASSLKNLSGVFTPTGGTPISTNDAVILLTNSGREGATDLNPTVTATIADLKSKCPSLMSGIVLGGAAAIPAAVFNSFKGLLSNSIQVAGTNRFDTARQIGLAVKNANGGLPTVNFYANSVAGPGFNVTGSGVQSLTNTVFLAEGFTGADALAVGSLAASKHVPLLLTDTAGLAPETANALAALQPKNIVVLGGPAAINDPVVTSAGAASPGGATTTRVFGANRYATSVSIAEQLFNLYPAYAAAHPFSNQEFGFSRDEGTAAAGNHTGWPDALSSAFYLDEVGKTASLAPPLRLAPPVEANNGSTTIGGSVNLAEVPLLLTPGASLAPEVNTYLNGMLPPSTSAYRSATNPGGANQGGFGFIFGGTASVQPLTVSGLGLALSGGNYTGAVTNDLTPSVTAASEFYTGADLTPVTSDVNEPTGVAASPAKACTWRNGYSGTQFAVATNHDGSLPTPANETQQVQYTGSSGAFPAMQSKITCVALADSTSKSLFYGQSLSGHPTAPTALDYTMANVLHGAGLGSASATNSGDITPPIASGTSEQQTITFNNVSFPVTYKGTTTSGAVANIKLILTRTKGANSTDFITMTGTVTVLTMTAGATIFTANITQGESSTTVATASTLSSSIPVIGEYTAVGTGAFVANVTPGASPNIVTPVIDGNA